MGLITIGAIVCMGVGGLVGYLLLRPGEPPALLGRTDQPNGSSVASPQAMVLSCPHATVIGVVPDYDEGTRQLTLIVPQPPKSRSLINYVSLLAEIGSLVQDHPISSVALANEATWGAGDICFYLFPGGVRRMFIEHSKGQVEEVYEVLVEECRSPDHSSANRYPYSFASEKIKKQIASLMAEEIVHKWAAIPHAPGFERVRRERVELLLKSDKSAREYYFSPEELDGG